MRKLFKDYPERILGALAVLFAGIAIGISMLFLTANSEKTEALPPSINSSGSVIININTANAEELKKLDGISDTIAREIVAYREKHGDFASKEDLLKVRGIGEKKLKSLQNYIRTE